MRPDTEAILLRIFIGEEDKISHMPLYEAIIKEARKAGLAGATAFRGILSFGKSTKIKTSKILDLSSDLPIIIEIVDTEDKIEAFKPILDKILLGSASGGLVTIEKVRIIKYDSRILQ